MKIIFDSVKDFMYMLGQSCPFDLKYMESIECPHVEVSYLKCAKCFNKCGIEFEIEENKPNLYSDEDLISHPFD